MEKCEIRKKILKHKRDIKGLRSVKVETEKLRTRQLKDLEIIKGKIKELEKELRND